MNPAMRPGQATAGRPAAARPGPQDPSILRPEFSIWGVGNPGPDWNGDGRKGDNLYTCSLLALDLASGKLSWHFQFTPHDTHDWDQPTSPC